LIISNDLQNEFDDKIIIVPITTERLDIINPFEVYLEKNEIFGLDKESKILLNYPLTIQKNLRLKHKLGFVSENIMNEVKIAWEIALS
jgi:mRNA-degrading endonuclease toxin of MazEF toxin-antitoxin module